MSLTPLDENCWFLFGMMMNGFYLKNGETPWRKNTENLEFQHGRFDNQMIRSAND